MLSVAILDRALVVRDSERYHADEPIETVCYWPTRFYANDLDGADVADVQVMKDGHGYLIKFPGCGFWSDCPLRGDSRPVKAERVQVAPPKVRAGIELKWRNYRWEKRLKSGWTAAY